MDIRDLWPALAGPDAPPLSTWRCPHCGQTELAYQLWGGYRCLACGGLVNPPLAVGDPWNRPHQ